MRTKSDASTIPPLKPSSAPRLAPTAWCCSTILFAGASAARADIRGAGPRQPATRVHVDQTVDSGPNRVREHCPDEADQLLKGRVQVINLWRPIRGPLRDSPLAMCDGTSVAKGDLVASDLIYPNRSGETYSVKYNPNHRWFYFPEMTADEALLLKCYDSADDGRTRFGPHTAFTDPTTPVDAAAAREHRAARAGVSQGMIELSRRDCSS